MCGSGDDTQLYYYRSKDLDEWEKGELVFEITEDSWAYKDVWAGEVHEWKGKFYLFVSLKGKHEKRGTQVLVADTPRGPFKPMRNRPTTPMEQGCIDGTFFVEDGKPYIVYDHDWPDRYLADRDRYVGEIVAAELSDDLAAIVGTPFQLFSSDDDPISAATPHHFQRRDTGEVILRHGADGPFLQRLSNGSLLLTWSPYLENNYVVLGAVSESGRLAGPWRHLEAPIFEKDGGHCMFFRDKAGRNIMSLHSPEKKREQLERAHFFEMTEKDGTLVVVKEI